MDLFIFDKLIELNNWLIDWLVDWMDDSFID